ncbi:MAG: hypothetical protein MK212_12810 [Saprospiraceae bacterium]|nr:hypothetical protein [Saprospiraceae bacterium]
MQQTTKNWGEIYKAKDLVDLKLRLDNVGIRQRVFYQVCRLNYRTCKEAFPQLWTNPNRYQQKDFSAGKAFLFLQQQFFVRRVNKVGRVSLYGHYYTLGAKYK